MKSVIVGTAGHIDHGKTALVKALTGIDADRLEEEKRRGITIDIGFARLELAAAHGEKLRLGFVDVPGHERFVRNMLAGVGGIDMVLLVIGADESIKPQTREHFDICRLLSIRRGITVLTKSDLVDRETLDVVRLEVEEFLRGSFLEGAPVVAVSSKTGEGIDELKRALASVASEVAIKDSTAVVRLPIDRVFTMKGFGTVVTGTLLSGMVRKEEELEVFPGGKRLRVRGVQVHGAAAEQAVAGERTALNLVGATTADLARGMALTKPDMFRATKRVDVSLNLLPSARLLRDRARVHLHAHTAETIAEVVLLGTAEELAVGSRAQNAGSADAAKLLEDQPRQGRQMVAQGASPGKAAKTNPSPVGTAQQRARQLAPGTTAFAQLRLADPLLLLPGDRFILRQFSPVVTIGGGVVLDAAPIARRASVVTPSLLQNLAPEEILWTRVGRRGPPGLTICDAVAETGWLPQQVEAVASELANQQRILRFADVLIFAPGFNASKNLAVADVTAFQAANPLVAGISKEELREKLGLRPEVFNGVLDALVRERKLEITGEHVRAAGRGVVMKDEEAESKRQIEQAFATAGLKVPALKEVLAGLKVDRPRAQKIVTLLLRDKVLVKVSEELVFHRDVLDGLRREVAAYKAKSPRIDVAAFKDLTGVSRKYAIPLLEYLDREHVTRRVGDERVIL